MNQDTAHQSKPASDRLHPVVYLALIGAALVFASAVWSFAADSYTDYLLVIVSAFALVATSIPVILSRVGTRDPGAKPRTRISETFREWMKGDFETWQDRVKAKNAAVEILLPMSAVAIGMVAIGIVLHFTPHGGA
jgi:hypothetical protein